MKMKYVDENGEEILEMDYDIWKVDRIEEIYSSDVVVMLINHCSKLSKKEIYIPKIVELQQKLSETDYVVIKVAESQLTGVPLDDERAQTYADIITQREKWREEIRKYEAELEDRNGVS